MSRKKLRNDGIDRRIVDYSKPIEPAPAGRPTNPAEYLNDMIDKVTALSSYNKKRIEELESQMSSLTKELEHLIALKKLLP